MDDAGLPGRPQRGDHAVGDRWLGRLRHDDDHVRLRVARERLDPEVRHPRGDGSGQVAPACPDRLRDATTEPVDERGDLLNPGAGGPDDSDRAASDDVGEAERRSVEDGGSAVGSHHQQAALDRFLLEGDLVLDGDVVRKEHHVKPLSERAARLAGRVRSGDGDQRQVRVRIDLDRLGDRRRLRPSGRAAFLDGRSGQQQPEVLVRLLDRGVRFPVDRDDKIICANRLRRFTSGERYVRIVRLGNDEAGRLQVLEVGRSPHRDGRLIDVGEPLELPADSHQEDRVEVAVSLDQDPLHPASPRSRMRSRIRS